ncbi:TetR/AcrR family transcriptional regulator [Sneathiella chinensis]|uniref:HTH tetR-type domain-containing protein n=1 Tax=Sneathiella chinensis TaxID=349750 RepID=A0ABQ5U0H9_9PROT|nr:TetR/AcrR family transcriptional regulator [Sneathiella chinensis]GLQ05161.1 hypothetical protein GCM10007924_03820 [Sneathiella chinensis]
MTASNPHANDLRASILASVMRLITRNGYYNITDESVAREAGLSVQELGKFYPSFAQLLAASFGYQLDLWEQERNAEIQKRDGKISAEDYVELLWNGMFRQPEYVASLELLMGARGDLELREAMEQQKDRLLKFRNGVREFIGHSDQTEEERSALVSKVVALLRGLSIQNMVTPEKRRFHDDLVRGLSNSGGISPF